MMSLPQLADFVQMAAPKHRFADLIASQPYHAKLESEHGLTIFHP